MALTPATRNSMSAPFLRVPNGGFMRTVSKTWGTPGRRSAEMREDSPREAPGGAGGGEKARQGEVGCRCNAPVATAAGRRCRAQTPRACPQTKRRSPPQSRGRPHRRRNRSATRRKRQVSSKTGTGVATAGPQHHRRDGADHRSGAHERGGDAENRGSAAKIQYDLGGGGTRRTVGL